MKKYYYTDGSNNYGPFTIQELNEASIAPNTLVWFQELGDWQPAGNVPELAELFAANNIQPQTSPQTPPPSHQYQQQGQSFDSTATRAPQKPLFEIQNLTEIFIRFFKEPLDGVSTLLKNSSVNSFTNTIILYAATAILFFAGGVINFGKYGLLYFLFPLLGMIFISLFTFLIKLFVNKPDLKEEFFTGAVCAIPYLLLIALTLISKLFGTTVRGPFGFGSYTMAMIVFSFFIILLVNVVQQSLRSSSIKDAVAWYMAPVVVFLSYFLSNELYTFLMPTGKGGII